MKYSRSTITQLTRWYKQVLIKCAILNAAVLLGAVATPTAANATTSDIDINGSGSGTHKYISGYANTSKLYVSDENWNASPSNYTNTFTDWVNGDVDDTVTVSGGKLITVGLSNNGYLHGSSGNIDVQSGRLTVRAGSYINSNVNLSLGSGAELYMNSSNGSITLNGDNISSGKITALKGTLTSTSELTLDNGSTIGADANLQVTNGALNIKNANVTLNGSDSVSSNLINATGGSLWIDKDLTLGSNSQIKNDASLTINGSRTITITGNADINANANDSISSATMNITGGKLSVNGGTHEIQNNSTVNGGTLAVTGGNVSIFHASVVDGKLAVSGGDVNIHDTEMSGGTTSISGGTVDIYDSTMTGGTLAISDGEVDIYDAEISGGTTSITGGDVDILAGTLITGDNLSVTGGDVDVAFKESIKTNFTKGGGYLVLNSAGELGEFTKNITTVSTGIDEDHPGTIVLNNIHYNGELTGSTNDVVFTHNEGSFVRNDGIIEAKNLYVGDGTSSTALRNMFGAALATTEDFVVYSDSSFINGAGADLEVAGNLRIQEDGEVEIVNAADVEIAGIQNGGDLQFLGGTNMSDITGYNDGVNITYGDTIFQDTNNAADVEQTNVLFSSAVELKNSGNLTAWGLENSTAKLTNTEDGVLTVNDSLFNNSTITNNGVLNLNGGDMTINNTIDGEGTTNINAGAEVKLADDAVLDNDIYIAAATTSPAADAGYLVANANSIWGEVVNDGDLELTGGIISEDITGDGITEISGNVLNDALLQNDMVVIDENASLMTEGVDDVDDPTTGLNSYVHNDGSLDLIGGTLKSQVLGNGTTHIDGDVDIDDNNGEILQKVEIYADSSLKANASNVIGLVDVAEGSVYTLTGGDIQANITGSGTIEITGNVTNTNDSTIAPAIEIAAAGEETPQGSLTTSAASLLATATVDNGGELNLVGSNDDENPDTLLAEIKDTQEERTGVTNIEGYISTEKDITQSALNVGIDSVGLPTYGSLASSGAIVAEDVNVQQYAAIVLTDDGLINTDSLENNGTVENNGSGDIVVGDNFKNYGDINNLGSGDIEVIGTEENPSTINNYEDGKIVNTGTGSLIAETIINEEGADIISTADGIKASTGVINDGDLELVSGELSSYIFGDGTTSVTGNNVSVNDDKGFISNKIEIASSGKLTANADNLAGDITSNGTAVLTGGDITTAINGGALQISGDTVVDNDSIAVASTTIDADKKLTVGSHTFNGGAMTNNGTLDVDITTATKGETDFAGSHVSAGSFANNGTLNVNVGADVLDVQHADSGNLALIQGLDSAIGGTITVNNAANDDNNDFKIITNADGSVVLRNNNSYAETSAAEAGSQNNMNTAVGVDNALNLAAGTEMRDVQKQLNVLSKKDAGAYVGALTDLAPTDSAVLTGVTQDFNNLLDQEVSERMYLGWNSGDVFNHNRVWGQVLYNHSKQDSSHKTAGFKGDTTGLAFGVDGELNNHLMLGLGYAYGISDVDSAGRNTDIKSHNFFAYGKYKPAAWFVRGMLNYGMADYKEKANILGHNNKSKYDVDNIGARAYLGYDFCNGLTPEAGLRYTHIMRDNYTDSLGQHVDSKDIDVLTAVLGVNYSTSVRTYGYRWTPKAHLAFTYDVSSDNSDAVVTVGDSGYTIRGEKLKRFGTEAGIGAEMSVGNWDLSVGYDLGIRSDYTSHTGMFNAKYNF